MSVVCSPTVGKPTAGWTPLRFCEGMMFCLFRVASLQIPSPLPSPPSCPRYYTVPGLGRFTLRANGHIRCVFVDRTIVDFYLPPSQPSTTPRLITGSEHSSSNCGGSSANSPCPPGMSVAGGARGVEVARGVWIGGNLCRVMQPNGRYKMVSTQHPSSHHRWVCEIRKKHGDIAV